MRRRPPISTRTDTLFPYTTLFRSAGVGYLLRPGFDLPAMTFTFEQLDALAMGLSFVEAAGDRSDEHTSELQSLMRISYAVFCLKQKKSAYLITNNNKQNPRHQQDKK